MNMLQIIQAATAEMGLPVPSYIAGNTADDAVQQLALLNAVGSRLQKEFDWQSLSTEYRFTTSASTLDGTTASGSAIVTGISSTTGLDTTYQVTGSGIDQDTSIVSVDSVSQVTLSRVATATATASLVFGKVKYSNPSDYSRSTPSTQWNKTNHWRLMGPSTPQEWQQLKSGYIASGPRTFFRKLAGYFQIWPMAATNIYLGMEYISSNWALSVALAGKSTFTADTDTCVFDDRLMIEGLKAEYFSVKGFDSSNFQANYRRELSAAKAADTGFQTLSFAGLSADYLIGFSNIPDSGYGQ